MTDMMRVPGDQPQTRTDLAAVALDLDRMAARLRDGNVQCALEAAATCSESARIHRRYAANQIRLKRDLDGMMADALSVARTREKEDMAAFVRLRFLGDLLAIPDTPPEDRP